MTEFVRRLVSGNKSRFKDWELHLELDLAYITDRVIVMGYPAEGLEGFYRNRREDAKKFLEHRHGKDFWVFNFCPVKENSYPADVFDGRVSRYPFPDHHAPPLAVLPLVAREMRLWLQGSNNRVAVLHCKAGKGRSGTMACTYLLSIDDAPRPPRIQRSHTKSERAKQRAEELMNTMPADDTSGAGVESQTEKNPLEEDPVRQELSASKGTGDATITSNPPPTPLKSASTSNSLNHILELHTSARMKRPSSPSAKVKHGVSIPSQRRWLYYWSLLLAHQEPLGFWSPTPDITQPKIRLTRIKVRMRELTGIKSNLVKAANVMIDRTKFGKATHLRHSVSPNGKKGGQVWVSLARYDDELVDTLETWERRTRSDDGKLGRRKPGSDEVNGERLDDIFRGSEWDEGKMVKCFARLGMTGDVPVQTETTEKNEIILAHELRPRGVEKWNRLRQSIERGGVGDAAGRDGLSSEETSLDEVSRSLNSNNGLVLDANREIRVKLYYGQVFMGWFWFIPAFHMSPRGSATESTTYKLTRKEIDFPLGVGSYLVDVEVGMEWCDNETSEVSTPPDTPLDSRGQDSPVDEAQGAVAKESEQVADL